MKALTLVGAVLVLACACTDGLCREHSRVRSMKYDFSLFDNDDVDVEI